MISGGYNTIWYVAGVANVLLQFYIVMETIKAIIGGITALMTVGLAGMPLIQIVGLIMAVVFLKAVIESFINSIEYIYMFGKTQYKTYRDGIYNSECYNNHYDAVV